MAMDLGGRPKGKLDTNFNRISLFKTTYEIDSSLYKIRYNLLDESNFLHFRGNQK